MNKLLLVILLNFSLFAGNLELESGNIIAHTEMIMDSSIDPENKDLKVDLRMSGDDITSLKGKITIEMELFKSDESSRDTAMYKIFNINKFAQSTYYIDKVTKLEDENNYRFDGELDLHGIIKNMSFIAKVFNEKKKIKIDAKSSLTMTEYNIEIPCMLFVCVRDKIDISAKLVLKK